MRKSAPGGGRGRHAVPPQAALLAPHCRFLEAPAQASPAEPTGPRATGRRPLQEFPSQRREASPRGPGAARGWGALTARRPPRPPKAASERVWGRAGCCTDTADSRCLALRCVPLVARPLGRGVGEVPPEWPRAWSPRDTGRGLSWEPHGAAAPREGPQGPSAVLRAGVSSRWGPPGEGSQRALGGYWGPKGGWGAGRWPSRSK